MQASFILFPSPPLDANQKVVFGSLAPASTS
jgi:hypothetical protein